jgi:hypothetical protein
VFPEHDAETGERDGSDSDSTKHIAHVTLAEGLNMNGGGREKTAGSNQIVDLVLTYPTLNLEALAQYKAAMAAMELVVGDEQVVHLNHPDAATKRPSGSSVQSTGRRQAQAHAATGSTVFNMGGLVELAETAQLAERANFRRMADHSDVAEHTWSVLCQPRFSPQRLRSTHHSRQPYHLRHNLYRRQY